MVSPGINARVINLMGDHGLMRININKETLNVHGGGRSAIASIEEFIPCLYLSRRLPRSFQSLAMTTVNED